MKPFVLLLLAALAPARAPDSLVEEFETAARSRYEESGVTFAGTKLAFRKVDAATVARLAQHSLAGLVQFTDESGGTRHVEVIVNNHHGRWRIVRQELLIADQPERWTPDALREQQEQVEADEFLETEDVEDADGSPSRLTRCGARRCVILFVDPWNPGVAELAELRRELRARGYPLRFVVTTDQIAAKKARARRLGPQAFVDPDDRFRDFIGNTPPVFLVVDDLGKIHKRMAQLHFHDIPAVVKKLLEPPPDAAPRAPAPAKTRAD